MLYLMYHVLYSSRKYMKKYKYMACQRKVVYPYVYMCMSVRICM
jgi:hypothetical protein